MAQYRFVLAIVISVVVSMTVPALAAESEGPFTVTGQFTYGSYSGSVERKSITSETLNVAYNPAPDLGLSLNLNHSDLLRKAPLDNIATTNVGATAFKFFRIENAGSLGGRISATYVSSDDRNSDNTLIPYVSLMYKTADSGKYVDIGYANSSYNDTTVNQYTLTGGIELFDWWTWSQTRLYFIDLSRDVQGKGSTFAVEERFTYYAIPKKLSFTLYGLIGQRIFAYDPDLGIVYNLSDVQKGSAGLTALYNFTKDLTAYADVTYEAYKNETINNNFHGVYWTAGMKYRF